MKNVNYPYMPEGRTIKYVDADNSFMILAKEEASKSNEKQQPTGAVIVANDKVVAGACNMNPLKSDKLIQLHKKFCIRHLLKIPSGEKYWMCPGCAGKESHAESRAIHKLNKIGFPNETVDIYLWGHWWCCDVCWGNMLRLPKLRDVYLLENSETLFNPKESGNIIGHQFD